MDQVPSEVISKLPESFEKGLASGDLLFFPSTVYKHEDYGVQVQTTRSVVFR